MAVEAAHRGRGRARQDDPGRDAAAPGMALRSSETHPRHGAQGGARSVADRASGEVQPQLADLRRAEAREISVARASRTARAGGRSERMAPGAGGHHLEPPDAPARPGARTPRRSRAVGSRGAGRGAPRETPRCRRTEGRRPERAARADAGARGPYPGARAAHRDPDAGPHRRGVGSARPAGPAPRVDRTGVPRILRRREPPEPVGRRDGAYARSCARTPTCA